ncbi:MAG: hypothetical protein M3Q58_09850 [Bacteroidota bacterium]|nr:hypothetical protein [Bacteroidota bacterium]
MKKSFILKGTKDETYSFFVMNNSFEVEYTIEDIYKGGEDNGYHLFNIDNEGSIYYFATNGLTNFQMNQNGTPSYVIKERKIEKIIIYNALEDYTRTSLTIESANLNTRNVKYLVTKKNELVAVALETNKLHIFNLNGKTKEIENMVEQDLSQLEAIKGHDIDYKNYDNSSFIEDPNGGLFLVTELFNRPYGKYTYDDMLVFSFSNKNEIIWSKLIKKRQAFSPKSGQMPDFWLPYFSFKSFLSQDELIVVYNENIKNELAKESDKMARLTDEADAYLVVCSMDKKKWRNEQKNNQTR